MTTGELQWLFGIFVTLGLAFAATIAGLRRTIASGDADLGKTVKAGDDALHERVNRVRDEYVKRVDHDAALNRIDQTLREMRDDQKEMHRAVLAALPKARGRGQ